MCDTLVKVTPDGTLFAKNSDRDANESQVLEWHPSVEHPVASVLRCTWIEVDQVARTAATLISRPWWMWGAEMGANEHGVVIGNEAVFTTEPRGEPALLGMDLVRLALERARDASSAASVIVELLERHGQGGPCSYERPGFTYDNSFLIADQTGAIVLETAGRHWASEEVRVGARSISNGLTIPGFAEAHARKVRARVVACRIRRARTEAAAANAQGPAALMAALRDHGGGPGPTWSPINGTLHAPCVHAGGLLASSQTTASLVSDLRGEPLHWATATSSPCTSLFKPIRVGEPHDLGPSPTNRFDPRTLWWRHEQVQRVALRDYARWLAQFGEERDEIERRWLSAPPASDEAFLLSDQLERSWLERMDRSAPDTRPRWVRRTTGGLDAASAFESTS